jgi:hypothetical protein
MKITIIHLYDGGLVEHYVGAVTGTLNKANRDALRQQFKADGSPYDEEDVRYMTFVEVECTEEFPKHLPNIEPDEDDPT